MRPGYSVTDADGGVETYELELEDIIAIIAEHFGVQPEEIAVDGIDVPEDLVLLTVRRSSVPIPVRR